MSNQIPLPKLPGMTFKDPREPVKTKPQTLSYINGYPLPNDRLELAHKDAAPAQPTSVPNATRAAAVPTTETLPAWVAYDRKVLRFNAYFKESVTEFRAENFRVRKCVIYFYLEDESIHVAEPKQQNSGIPQGVFLKRHRIPKGDSGAFFSIHDLNVGANVLFYGRNLHIYSCDPFTKTFLEGSGIAVPAEEPVPEEPLEVYRESLKKISFGPPQPRYDDLTRFSEAKLGRASNVLQPDKLKKFLDNDRKVLRFFCVWDDRNSLYGDRRPYVLHYFLADDTVEILEVNEANNGRDPFPMMLKRGKLPNQPLEVDALGPTKSYTHYTYNDLRVGGSISVLNRHFLIHDCDDFTRNWYIENLGYSEEDFTPVDIVEPPEPAVELRLPAYNGFGSRLDTVQNCISLIPKPPKKDFHKLMNNEKKVLRFVAQIVEDEKHVLTTADMDRKFILSFFLSDDSISIFEPPARNSGIIGGKFLERGNIAKPNDPEDLYKSSDFFVGAKLVLYNRTFLLVEADNYTYNYMEQHPENFPYSDYSRILAKIKLSNKGREDELRTAFIEMDTDGSGYLSLEELEKALKKAGSNLLKHEVISIMRRQDASGDGKISIEEFFNACNIKWTD